MDVVRAQKGFRTRRSLKRTRSRAKRARVETMSKCSEGVDAAALVSRHHLLALERLERAPCTFTLRHEP